MVNFRHHIDAARQTDLPLIVHTRDADDDTISVLNEEMARAPFTGLLHCFTGTPRLRDAALDIGFSISVSGIATFKNSSELRDTLKAVPTDRLLVETDAPYLAPMPHRGKRNEPVFRCAYRGDAGGSQRHDAGRPRRDNNRQFFSALHQGPASPVSDVLEATVLGCGSSGGVPRLGGPDNAGDWGRLRSAQSEKPPHAMLPARQAKIEREGNQCAGRYVAGHAPTTAGRALRIA
ncbi:MAG: TatD family hydrolase [Rhizomicrobium sp.]